MIPDETLAQWQALVDAATPGPWWSYGSWPYEVHGRTDEETGSAPQLFVSGHHGSHPDAAFIVASRGAVPQLLAEVAELRWENETYRDEIARREALTPEDFRDMLTSNRRLTRGDMFDLLEKLGEAQARIEAAIALCDEREALWEKAVMRSKQPQAPTYDIRRALTGGES